MDAIVFGGRSGLRLELHPAAFPYANAERLPAWDARLIGLGLDVRLLCPEADWEAPLAQFLTDLDPLPDGAWRWDRPRSWQSGEAELRLTVAQTAQNTVTLMVVLTNGAPPRWCSEAELELDPGAFGQIAVDARRLASVSMTM